jgi:diaminohydroxyphosphoribosylaminopyrimidine deaminase/5-amino-6-(5-phosphoribosylamino)uracil reductase
MYVTLEPCSTHGRTPPCVDAIIESGVRRVVVSVSDPNPAHAGKGIRLLKKAGIEVTADVCPAEGSDLIAPFAKWITTGVPYITLKLGMTLDGRIADTKGSSRWITSSPSRKLVDLMRKRVDAVLVGGHTIKADNPSLLCKSAPSRPRLRVAVDSSGTVPVSSKILTDEAACRTVIATTADCPDSTVQKYEKAGAAVLELRKTGTGVSLVELTRELARMSVLHVLCEGGGQLAGSLLEAGLVDDCVIFVSPKFLGDGSPAVAGKGWKLDKGPFLRDLEFERVGDDVMITGKVSGAGR